MHVIDMVINSILYKAQLVSETLVLIDWANFVRSYTYYLVWLWRLFFSSKQMSFWNILTVRCYSQT